MRRLHCPGSFMAQCRDVYYYESRFLKKERDGEHYHIVVLDIGMGEDGLPKKGVVIVTSYADDREKFYKQRGGEGSYVVLELDEYEELSHTSLVSGKIYEEDERNLLNAERKTQVSPEVLEKIRTAALKNKENKNRIKRLLR